MPRPATLRRCRGAFSLAALLVATMGLTGRPGRAQGIPVPLDLQVRLLGKILTFDRNLRSAVGGELTLGIVYQRRYRLSLDAMEEVRRALEAPPGAPLAGIPLRVLLVEASDAAAIRQAIADHELELLLVTPLRGLAIEELSLLARRHRVRTFSTVPEYVERGLALGVDLRGGRPEIVVNLNQALAEGSDLDSQLLKLARVIP